jgi:hypothetical protein
MRIFIGGMIVALLILTVGFGAGFLGAFGQSSSITTAGPPAIHTDAVTPKT